MRWLWIFVVASARVLAAEWEMAEFSFDARFADGTLPTNAPAWVVAVEQAGGQFSAEPRCWEVAETDPLGQGRLAVVLDREKLQEDVALTVLYEQSDKSDLIVQLWDSNNRVVVLDLFANLMVVGKEANTDTFIIPLRRHPTVTKIVLRRVRGSIKVYGLALYPVVTEAEADDEALRHLAKLLGDPLSPDNPLLRPIHQMAETKNLQLRWEERAGDSPGHLVTASGPQASRREPVVFRWAGLEWEALPWPPEDPWGGTRGVPAQIQNGDLILPGWYVRTRRVFTGPVTVEYELLLEETVADDGCVWTMLHPVGAAADTQPEQFYSLSLGYSPDRIARWELIERFAWQPALKEKRYWNSPPVSLTAGMWHRIQIKYLADGVQVTLNDVTFSIAAPPNPYKQFQLTLRGWQPENRWHVRKFTIR